MSASALVARLAAIPDHLSICHPALGRGAVWCRACGQVRAIDAAEAFRSGWPRCCGATMTIDRPARPTGAQLVAELRIAADRRGLSLWKFAAGINERPGAWLAMLNRRARPFPATVQKVRDFIDGAADA